MFGQFNLTRGQLVGLAITAAIIAALYFAGGSASPKNRAPLGWALTIFTIGALFYWMAVVTGALPADIPHLDVATGYLKAITAITAAACVYHEIRRVEERRPIALRWKKFVGLTLAVASIVLYFNGGRVGYQKFWHRHDQYHYYFGAKYFRELGYDGLYKCTIVAQDQIGKVCDDGDPLPCKPGHHQIVDMAAEVNPLKAPAYCPVPNVTTTIVNDQHPEGVVQEVPINDPRIDLNKIPADVKEKRENFFNAINHPAEFCETPKSDSQNSYECPVLRDACEKKIRNLGGDNLLKPATVALEHPEECDPSLKDASGKTVSQFTPERWKDFKDDIRFFRMSTMDGKDYWDGMQKDHGYNPPPVWTLTGYLIASTHRATEGFMQFLGMIDQFYLLAMFVGIYWAFGWRVFSVAAILWGCQASAPNFWTLGAFLRQDWLFWFVMATCFARKKYFKLAGASMVYAALLRVFPGLAVIGWLTVAGAYLVRHKRFRPQHLQTLAGGTLAAIVLVGASLVVVGKDSYQQFYKHTIEVHDQTPLTNHMGLRVMVGHRTECIAPDGLPPGIDNTLKFMRLPSCEGARSGRMQYTQDDRAQDPFEVWKDMRLSHYAKYKWVAYLLIAASFAFFVAVVRRVKTLWVAQALGQVWIVLLSQLTSYYYSFVIISAPLTRVRRDLEVPMFVFAALTQFVYGVFRMNDDKYSMLTYVTLGFCYYLIAAFAPKEWAFWKKKSDASAGTDTKKRARA